jgi:Tol biopolymer transport system component
MPFTSAWAKVHAAEGVPVGPPIFGAPLGCNGPVHAVVRHRDTLLLGGRFSLCGDQPAAGLAAYDRVTRRFAGFGAGIDGTVLAIHVNAEAIYVGGDFELAGGQPARNVARWQEGRWRSLGEGAHNGVDGDVRALAVLDGSIHVGGEFRFAGGVASPNLAQWNGEVWLPFGTQRGGPDAAVESLLSHDGQLFVAGRFEQVGSVPSALVAAWDGEVWSSVGGGFGPSSVEGPPLVGRQLLLVNDRLLLVGNFGFDADRQLRGNIQQLVGERWQRYGRAWARPIVAAAAIDDRVWISDGDAVFDANVEYAVLRGGPLHALEASADGVIFAGQPGLVFDPRSGRTITIGSVGNYTDLPPPDSRSQISSIGAPLINGSVLATLTSDDGIYVGGRFDGAPIPPSQVGYWNGASWRLLGTMPASGIRTLARYQGQLYAGGDIHTELGEQAYIARWDGSQWNPLDSGVQGQPNEPAYVAALHEYAGDLWVGGRFNRAGSVFVGGIARWDGLRWDRIGPGPMTGVGFFYPFICSACERVPAIESIALHRGQIHLGGRFTVVLGGSSPPPYVPPVVVWDGGALRPLLPSDGGLDDLYAVTDLHSHADELLIASPTPARCDVIGWDGVRARSVFGADPGAGESDLRCPRSPLQLASQAGQLHLSGNVEIADGSLLRAALMRADGDQLEPISPAALSSPGNPPHLSFAGDHLLLGDLPYARFPTAVRASERQGMPGDDSSAGARLSRNGSKLAFGSAAGNLGALHSGTAQRIYLRDLASGRLQALSDLVANAGLTSTAVAFGRPSLSADALTLAFEGDDGQLYVVDAHRPVRLSVAADGSPGDDLSITPSVSPDGSQVAFATYASNLLPGVGGATRADILLRDLHSGQLELVSTGELGSSRDPALANTGIVAFGTESDTLQQIYYSAPGANGRSGFFVSRNRHNNQLGNGASSAVQLSADGRFGVFQSEASNLVAGDSNSASDIFWFEVANGELARLERVSLSSYGLQADGPSLAPGLSDDGQLISFHSIAGNLIELDHNGVSDVFVHFRASGQTRRFNGTLDGQPSQSHASDAATLSGDGSTLAFSTLSPNLGGDQNSQVVYSHFARPRRDDGYAALDLPAFSTQPLPLPLTASVCPGGYFLAMVDDGDAPGLRSGRWGMELLMHADGAREFAGGLNFGGLIDTLQPGFAGFNIANPRGEAQLLEIEAYGRGLYHSTSALSVSIVLRRPDGGSEVLATETSLRLDQPWRHTLTLQPGFHVLEVHALNEDPHGAPSAAGGAAAGQVVISATTRFPDRSGGSFQGGVVVGGYHGPSFNGGVTGYAGFCAPKPELASARLVPITQNPDDPSLAGDLRLRLLDRDRVTLIEVDSR